MSSSTKTPNYNLSQFGDTDKPTWRGDYTGDMAKIDRGMQCNANAAADAHTAAVNAQNTADRAQGKADTNATAIAQVKTTADNAMSLAQTNEADITANDSEFQQYKSATDAELASMTQQINLKANAADVPTKAYADAHYAGHLTGQAVAYKTGTEREFTMTSPTDYKEVTFDGTHVLDADWSQLGSNQSDVLATPGVYLVSFELRLINIAAGGEQYKTSIRCEISNMSGSSPQILGYCDTYFVKDGTESTTIGGTVQGATLSIVESVVSSQNLHLRLHAPHMNTGHAITGKVNHAAISIVKLADIPTSTRARGISAEETQDWTSGM